MGDMLERTHDAEPEEQEDQARLMTGTKVPFARSCTAELHGHIFLFTFFSSLCRTLYHNYTYLVDWIDLTQIIF